MKRFIKRILLYAIIFVTVNIVLVLAVPKDRDNYLCEYNDKVKLLKETPQPRVLFIGGSNIAFGMDSRTVMDSLHIHVVNFGLHGGIGIRYPLEDCLHYVREGDVAVIQMEYGNFFSGGNGEVETFLPFMIATDWRNAGRLNVRQWHQILSGIPRQNTGIFKRFIKYLVGKVPGILGKRRIYMYQRSGFNEYGDEVSHLDYPSESYVLPKPAGETPVDEDFVVWLSYMIQRYEDAGATVVLLPPVCLASYFKNVNNRHITEALDKIGHSYIVEPSYMVLDDSCTFNTGYHVNREGVRQNTEHVIYVLKHNEIHPGISSFQQPAP